MKHLGNKYPIPASVTTLLDSLPVGEVFLTGSRWLGYASPSSDWDFFIQSCPMHEKTLQRIGYTQIPTMFYSDPSVVKVYLSPCGEIHIQLVRDSYLKSQVQDKIAPTLRSLYLIKDTELRKKTARLVWQAALRAAQ